MGDHEKDGAGVGGLDVGGLDGVVARVRATLERFDLLAPGERVLVACSGGPDSVALLGLLLRCDPSLRVFVGHVDHGLRAGSAAEGEMVADLASSLGLELLRRRLDLAPGLGDSAATAQEMGALSEDGQVWVSEDVARRGRLAALEEMAAQAGATAIALGHTADDQLETLLMRLCRGAGLTGMAGMAPRRGPFVRPLLEVGRREVVLALRGLGWSSVQDPSNGSRRFFRNRIRLDVVPALKRENPRLLEAVTRVTRTLREELDALRHVEAVELARLSAPDPMGEAVGAEGLAGLPAGLAARLVRILWRRARARVEAATAVSAPAEVEAGDRRDAAAELGRRHVEETLRLLAPGAPSRLDLPGGVAAYRQYDLLVLAPARLLEDPGDVEVSLPGPGQYTLPEIGAALEVGSLEVGSPGAGLPESAAAPWPLLLRNSRPGDRVHDRLGPRKLSDLLVKHRVPRFHRRRLPVVLLDGKILWVFGVWHGQGAVLGGEGRRLRLDELGAWLCLRSWDPGSML